MLDVTERNAVEVAEEFENRAMDPSDRVRGKRDSVNKVLNPNIQLAIAADVWRCQLL